MAVDAASPADSRRARLTEQRAACRTSRASTCSATRAGA